MKLFEKFAIYPFSSLDELEIAFNDAKSKCDPMKQADINELKDAYDEAKRVLNQEPEPGHFLGLIQSIDDLIYVLKKFPEHGYQIIACLDNDVCQFGLAQIMNAFTRNAFAMSAVVGTNVGLFVGFFAATARFCKESLMQMQDFSPLARLVFSSGGGANFDALMMNIEPSLVLYIGFRLCHYREFGQLTSQFEKNTGGPKLLGAGIDYFAGEHVSFTALTTALWPQPSQEYERTRHLLAYITAMYKLEGELYAMPQCRDDANIKSVMMDLFIALKYVMILDMQHVDIDTLQRNQTLIPLFHQNIAKSIYRLNALGAANILHHFEKNMPFAFQVHLSNALLTQGEVLPLLEQTSAHPKVLLASLPEDTDAGAGQVEDKQDEESHDFVAIEINETNPFKDDYQKISLEMCSFINNTLNDYKDTYKANDVAKNGNLFLRVLYLIKIKAALEAINAKINEQITKQEPTALESYREQIQAYCHLLQYVANIETGQFAACTTKITESFDQKMPCRLTGTRCHENLIQIFRDEYLFTFNETQETKKQFLNYVTQKCSPEWIIQELRLGHALRVCEAQAPSPKEMVKAGVGAIWQFDRILLTNRFSQFIQDTFSETVEFVYKKFR